MEEREQERLRELDRNERSEHRRGGNDRRDNGPTHNER